MFPPFRREVGPADMDSYREHPSDFDYPGIAAEVPADQAAAGIGTDERRMHVRAYNHWVSLLKGRDYPSIADLEPSEVEDFAANSVLLDFTGDPENPRTPYIGAAIREECGIGSDIRSIGDVPSRSLLSRLTDHYLQIIANRAPIGFEAEFVNQRGAVICYRGILMPFSSDGATIDFIYGVINWKRSDAADDAAAAEAPAEPFQSPTSDRSIAEIEPEPHPVWEDGPCADPDDAGEMVPMPGIVPEGETLPVLPFDISGLADCLSLARESADDLRQADSRSRAALYRALSAAYDFALAARDAPEEFAELLEDSGVKAQERAPMTPVVKLVFGIDYDKGRLTEFAAALSHGVRLDVPAGGFLSFIEGRDGGLKSLVAAERLARRPATAPGNAQDRAREKLREAPPLDLGSLQPSGDFTLVLARRLDSGGVEAVALIEDAKLVERAIRAAA
jgi:hypothetical protein